MKDHSTRMSELMDIILKVRFSDLELERENCLELLTLADKGGSTYAKAFAYTYLGDYYLAKSDADNSGQYLHWARALCTEYDFEALYMRVCHLSGFYYHIVYDEQNALQYYMEALALGKEFNDIQQICNTWNNIADMFQSHGAFEEAKQYYLRAYEAMVNHHCKDSRLLLMILHNLAEVTGLSGDAEGMEQYLAIGEKQEPFSDSEKELNQLSMLSGRCIQAALRGERDRAIQIAEQILKYGLYELEDRYFVIELLFPVAHELVKLGEADCSKHYITVLSECASRNEINFAQRLLRLRVLYAETFSDLEARNASYQDYYYKMESIITAEDGVRVNGMKAKIHLQEVIRQQESTQQENRRLRNAANIDALTGIYNRRHFDHCIGKAAEAPFGVIMLDIDFFKEFNDNYGHIQGDRVLREVGAALKAHASADIVPCRYGGDEFACICTHCTDQEIECYIAALSNRIKKLNLVHEHSGCAKQVTLSIGYCSSDTNAAVDTKKVLAGADRALYRAKMDGRNCCRRERAEDDPATSP